MRIALSLGLNVDYKRGVDSYYEGLINGLARVDQANEYHLLSYFLRGFEAKRRKLPFPHQGNFKQRAMRWPSSVVERLEWSWGVPIIDWAFARGGGFDVFHGLCNILPRLRGIKTVVTVHDLMPEVFATWQTAPDLPPRTPVAGLTGPTALRADRVIATSTGTRDDLVRMFGVDPAKITVILYGADEVFRPTADTRRLAQIRATYDLNAPYVMFMGPFQWRHNTERVLDAIAKLRAEGIGQELLLAFVGAPSPYRDRVIAHARRLGIGAQIRCLGYVPRADLPNLYQQAVALAHPTLYGGGLPVYEALASGGVILTSSNPESTMPEIVGDAALMADPKNTADIAGALHSLIVEPELARRLREKAASRGRELTWDRAARETLRIYEELASGLSASRRSATR